MKSSFASRLATLLAIFLFFAGQAQATMLADGWKCLREYDLSCALQIRAKLLADHPDDPEVREYVARTYFHEGRFEEALRIADQLSVEGHTMERYPPPYAAAAEAAEDFERLEQDAFVVRYAPGVDKILVEEAVEVLQSATAVYEEVLGELPDYPIHLDIFPSGSRFIAASGLPAEAVQTTGVIALSKWNRLLLTSPRALSRGYAWKDTIAHEYIHLLVAYRTKDNTPVWLQEGLAKYLEGYWRNERSGGISVSQQSLLARAVHEDSFVPFEKFRHSMAYLDSGSEAALAFAQVATMVGFMVETRGEAGLRKVLDEIRGGADSQEAFAEVAGYADFDAFTDAWKDYVRALPLVEQKIATLPVNLDEAASAWEDDPALADRQDLRKFARIGDLLREKGHYRAALVEYDKATTDDGPPSPTLIARRARCHMGLGDIDEALSTAQQGVKLYPEFTLLQVALAEILDAQGRLRQATQAWRAAHDLNPFDPKVQAALAANYEALGNDEMALRHERYGRLLSSGGVIDISDENAETGQ